MPHNTFDPGILRCELAAPPRKFSSNGSSRTHTSSPNLAVIELHLIGLTSSEALNLVAREALGFTKADGAAIAVMSGDQATCCATSGSLAPPLGSAVKLDSGVSGACMRSREVINCRNTDGDPRVDAEACRQAGIRSMLAVPLIHRERASGVFAVFSRKAEAFADREMEVMLLLSGLIPNPEAAPAPRAEYSLVSAGKADPQFVVPDSTNNEEADQPVETVVVSENSESNPIRPERRSRPRPVSTSRQISNCLETIRQDPGLQLLGRVKAYLTIESLYDATERTDAIELCGMVMLERAQELGAILSGPE